MKRHVRFTITVSLEDLGTFPSMRSAFYAFHAAVTKKFGGRSRVSLQEIESCWIQRSDCIFPLFFNDIVVLATNRGWLKKGKLVKKS